LHLKAREKTKKKKEEVGELKLPLCWRWWKVKLPHLATLRNTKKNKIKNKKQGAKSPSLLPMAGSKAPLPTCAQKHTKRQKKEEWVHVLSWSSRWSSLNFRCSCSRLSRFVTSEVHAPSSPSFSLVKLSKLQVFQAHTKSQTQMLKLQQWSECKKSGGKRGQ
jgi:hypothetical protein